MLFFIKRCRSYWLKCLLADIFVYFQMMPALKLPNMLCPASKFYTLWISIIFLTFLSFFVYLVTRTARVTSSDPQCVDGNTRFTRVPLEAFSDQVWIRYQCFCFWSTFRFRKTTVSSTFLLRLRLQGYHCK